MIAAEEKQSGRTFIQPLGRNASRHFAILKLTQVLE
jgi:hypothetical protein